MALDATAERLPFADISFDAATASFTVHQWSDLAAGPGELRRATRGPVVILTCDPAPVDRFWLNDYAPEAFSAEGSNPRPRQRHRHRCLGPQIRALSPAKEL